MARKGYSKATERAVVCLTELMGRRTTNVRARKKRTVSETGLIDFGGVRVSVGSTSIAAIDTMRITDTQGPTMRFSAAKTVGQQAGRRKRCLITYERYVYRRSRRVQV